MDIGLTVVIVLVALATVALLAAQARHRRRAAAELIDPDRSTRDLATRPDELWTGVDRSGGGWHGPSASGGFPAVDPASREPQVPSQRTGEHDRDQREPADGEHCGPVRRLLRRRG